MWQWKRNEAIWEGKGKRKVKVGKEKGRKGKEGREIMENEKKGNVM